MQQQGLCPGGGELLAAPRSRQGQGAQHTHAPHRTPQVAPVPAPPALKPDSEEEGSRDSRDQQVAARRSSHSKTSTSASPPKPRAKARGEYEDLDDTAGSRKGGHDLGGRGLHEAANGGAAAAAPAPPSPAGAGSTALPPIALHAPASPRALPTSFWGGPAPDLAAPRGRVSEIKAHGPRHRRSGSQSSQTSQQGGGRPGSGQVSQRRHRRKGKGKGGAEFDVSNSWEEQLPTLLAQSSLGNVVGGEALGLPGPRYPAPKRTQQQQFEAADSAADAAAAVLAAAALRCADRHAPGNSLATCDSWVADAGGCGGGAVSRHCRRFLPGGGSEALAPLLMPGAHCLRCRAHMPRANAVEHDLELSLPPSCFTSNINTRVGSRVDGELREQLLLSQVRMGWPLPWGGGACVAAHVRGRQAAWQGGASVPGWGEHRASHTRPAHPAASATLLQAGASESQQGLPGHKQPLRSARSRQWR